MKYENWNQVTNLCEKISKAEQTMKDLNSGNIVVTITDNTYKIMTIGTWVNCEHEHAKLAKALVSEIRVKIQSEIADLKLKLAEL